MPEQIGAAPAEDRFSKYFITTEVAETPSGVIPTDVAPVQTPPAIPEGAAPQAPAAASAPEPEPEPKGGLADKIRAEREAKYAKAKQIEEAKTWRERAEAAETELSKLRKSDVVADAVGWAQAMGLEREEIATVGESLLYSLVPDKATAEARIKLMEAKQTRERKLAEESRAKAEAEAKAEETRRVHEQYVDALASHVDNLQPGAFPESETWFEEDHEAYVRSLYATANNMAENGRAQGRMPDLSFGAVAAVLEKDLAVRAQRLRTRGVAPIAQPKPEEGAGKKPEEIINITTRGLTNGGVPRPPARDEAERLARAAEVAFRTK